MSRLALPRGGFFRYLPGQGGQREDAQQDFCLPVAAIMHHGQVGVAQSARTGGKAETGCFTFISVLQRQLLKNVFDYCQETSRGRIESFIALLKKPIPNGVGGGGDAVQGVEGGVHLTTWEGHTCYQLPVGVLEQKNVGIYQQHAQAGATQPSPPPPTPYLSTPCIQPHALLVRPLEQTNAAV